MNVFLLLGFLCLAAGAVGLALPLLPTTPFVLLAAACFARSSPRWHRWMLQHQTFGPMVRNWERHRCVSMKVKLLALASMVLVGGYSLGFVIQSPVLRAVGAGLLGIGMVVVALLPRCPPAPAASTGEDRSD